MKLADLQICSLWNTGKIPSTHSHQLIHHKTIYLVLQQMLSDSNMVSFHSQSNFKGKKDKTNLAVISEFNP